MICTDSKIHRAAVINPIWILNQAKNEGLKGLRRGNANLRNRNTEFATGHAFRISLFAFRKPIFESRFKIL